MSNFLSIVFFLEWFLWWCTVGAQEPVVEQVTQVDPAIFKWYYDAYWENCGQIEENALPIKQDDDDEAKLIEMLLGETTPSPQARQPSTKAPEKIDSTRTLSISFPSEEEEAVNIARQDEINNILRADRVYVNTNNGGQSGNFQNTGQTFNNNRQLNFNRGSDAVQRRNYQQPQRQFNQQFNQYNQPRYNSQQNRYNQNTQPYGGYSNVQVIQINDDGEVFRISRKKRQLPQAAGAQKIYPWMVAIAAKGFDGEDDKKYTIWCGSTLITNKHLLTAANCFDIRRDPSMFNGLIRAHNLSKPEAVIGLKAITIHPDYQPGKFYNNVAIVTLEKVVPNFKVACLPVIDPQGVDSDGSKVQILGYGSLAFAGQTSPTLQVATLEVLSNQNCNANYSTKKDTALKGGIVKSQLCAGALDESRDACQNDSGSPLVNYLGKKLVVGVVSFGYQCAREGFPGVYSRVKEFLPWILPTIRKLS